ncbi:hypothetical protein BH11VER1_BH11VER1_01030 [soil metagenome]
MKTLFIILLIIAAMAVGWFARPYFSDGSMTQKSAGTSERKILFYQSAMHPWIKSDKPGRCTICGMELTPVYEGDKGMSAADDGNMVTLTQTQIQVLHVQTTDAKVQLLTKTLPVAGMVDDNTTRHRILSAYIDGRIDKLHVNFIGAEVEEGQPLAEFYSPTLLQSEREYRQLTGELKKNTGLRLRQMGLTPSQIEALDKKSADALTSQILSPVGGTVVSQHVYEGQYVTAGEKLLEIADFSTMWFMFRAYEQDMPWIKIGQSVDVTTPSLPGKVFSGKITFIDPNFDETTRSTQVRVELPNPRVNGRRELLHRLYADGVVKVDAPSLLAVPRSAVMETGPEAVVYVDEGGGAYTRKALKIGQRGDKLLEVLSGLKEGDKVVTNGNLLIDGQAEMNRSFMSPVEPPAPAMPLVALNETQQKAITDFVKLADAMAAALAADDLPAFYKASEPAMMLAGELTKSLRTREGTMDNIDALDKARHFHGFDNIQAAREAFHKFSMAAASVLEPLRTAADAPAFAIWECSMVDQAIPTAPKKGRWIQLERRPGQNPFFGKEMLECAKEIKR